MFPVFNPSASGFGVDRPQWGTPNIGGPLVIPAQNSVGKPKREKVQKHGPPGSFSASQVDAYDLCARKWAWRSIDKVEEPPNVYAAFGLELHGIGEDYLNFGTMPDLTTQAGEAFLAGIHFLPAPKTPGMVIEGAFALSAWGHHFFGLKDVQILDAVDPALRENVPQVWDHKSTGNLKYAKRGQELIDNIQAAIYAADAFTLRPSARFVDLKWVYYKRGKPFKAELSSVRVTREQIAPTLERVKKLSDDMSLIRLTGRRALQLPANPSACGAFGGCPYVSRCNLSPEEKMIAAMSNQDPKNAWIQGIRERQAAAGGAGPAVNPGQPPPQGPPPGYPPPQQPQAQGWPQQQPPQGPPPQQQPPQGPPPQQQPPPPQTQAFPPPQRTVDLGVLGQAQASHAGWEPGTQWWNGAAYVQPNDPNYPPIFLGGAAPQQQPPPQGSAPMPAPVDAPTDAGKTTAAAKRKAAREKMAQGYAQIAEAIREGALD